MWNTVNKVKYKLLRDKLSERWQKVKHYSLQREKKQVRSTVWNNWKSGKQTMWVATKTNEHWRKVIVTSN